MITRARIEELVSEELRRLALEELGLVMGVEEHRLPPPDPHFPEAWREEYPRQTRTVERYLKGATSVHALTLTPPG